MNTESKSFRWINMVGGHDEREFKVMLNCLGDLACQVCDYSLEMMLAEKKLLTGRRECLKISHHLISTISL